MNYNLFDFLQLLGALGIFIFGMKIFSDGLQRVAGHRLRAILSGMTRNRTTGVLTGFGATAITQSSTTTTVMVVSFVNAGLITFVESTGVIMGANIGTTITAWLVSIFGFKFQITPVAVAAIGLFFPFLFVRSMRMRSVAEAMIGFGILFVGLDFIKSSVPDINENPAMFAFLDSYTDYGYGSMLLFVVVGTVLTLLTQSSSAATAITLVMLFQGWISFPIAAAMILGENIGTTVTANIAAMIGNVHAKRAARFHFFFNVFGVVWMLIVMLPFLRLMDWGIQQITGNPISVFSDDPAARSNATLAISLFHTSFNVLNVLIMFAFVPRLVRFVEYLQPDREGTAREFHLRYISTGLMSSPALSLEQAQKETQMLAGVVQEMHGQVRTLVLDPMADTAELLTAIRAKEDVTDLLELEISDYLVRIAEGSRLEPDMTSRIRFMQSMINDLERIADIYYQVAKLFERLREAGVSLPPVALEEAAQMFAAVDEALTDMEANVAKPPEAVALDRALTLERRVNALRNALREQHYHRLEAGAYAPRAGVVYLDLVNRLERIADHILNVNEAAAGERIKARRFAEGHSGGSPVG
jgi:phosphate:Na+ symporter